MSEKRSSEPEFPPEAGTLPQWQPPAGATLAAQSGPRERAADKPAASDPPIALAATLASSTELIALPDGPPPLLPGSLVGGRYVIEQAISSGGFGAVYRASDKQIRNHQVALKLLHSPAGSEEAREQALRELTLIASVSHPSVVQFKDYGWQEGRLWFAMPWYEGATLDRRFDKISRVEARPIFERLARGLAAMHEVGIHHHDIKPENVFLADVGGFEGGFPVLLDLGIASPRGEGPAGLTVEYAAPETAGAALGSTVGPIGAAADVFSLALVLRNLLEPETAPALDAELVPLLRRRAQEPVPPPTSKDLRYLKSHFERWLNLDPDVRPTAEELAEEFAILTAPEERRESRRRLMRRLLPIVALASLAVAALWMQVTRQKTQLTVQQQRLSEEMRESDELRARSENQLVQLEQQMAAIGSKDRELERAVGIARRLSSELERTETERKNVIRKLKRTETDRDNVTQERDRLSQERDTLVAVRGELERTRDRLTQERDALTAERDRLERERDTIGRERDALRTVRSELTAKLAGTEQALAAAESEARSAQRDLQKSAAEREELRAEQKRLKDQLRDLDRENTKLLAARNKLEEQIQALQKRLARPTVRRIPLDSTQEASQ